MTVRIIHQKHCSPRECAKAYRVKYGEAKFTCPKCRRVFGYCYGGAPSPLCDECEVSKREGRTK